MQREEAADSRRVLQPRVTSGDLGVISGDLGVVSGWSRGGLGWSRVISGDLDLGKGSRLEDAGEAHGEPTAPRPISRDLGRCLTGCSSLAYEQGTRPHVACLAVTVLSCDRAPGYVLLGEAEPEPSGISAGI